MSTLYAPTVRSRLVPTCVTEHPLVFAPTDALAGRAAAVNAARALLHTDEYPEHLEHIVWGDPERSTTDVLRDALGYLGACSAMSDWPLTCFHLTLDVHDLTACSRAKPESSWEPLSASWLSALLLTRLAVLVLPLPSGNGDEPDWVIVHDVMLDDDDESDEFGQVILRAFWARPDFDEARSAKSGLSVRHFPPEATSVTSTTNLEVSCPSLFSAYERAGEAHPEAWLLVRSTHQTTDADLNAKMSALIADALLHITADRLVD